MRRRLLITVGATVALLLGVGPVSAANQPGDACPTNGAVEPLGSGFITCTNGTWQPSGGPQPSTPGGTTPSTTPASSGSTITALKAFTPIGTALSGETFGSSKGQVADPSAIRLPDGRVRVFVFVADEGVRSATSTTSAGTSFVADPTRPIPWTMAGQPRAVSLGGSQMRLFYLSAGSIQAARSSDGGLTFTDEGPVITSEQAGFEPGGISIVKQGSGYRAYFSNLERPGVVAPRVMRTATSTDMLHWTMGPVLTQEGGSITGGGSHPFAVIDKKGRIALYYSGDRGSYYGIIVSTSRNGVTFGKERSVMAGGGDGDVLAAGKKGGLMYYGYKLPGSAGFGVNVARTTTSLVPTIR
jgi:hypothetical protein